VEDRFLITGFFFVAVEATYDGPRINEETKKIDLPFVQALVERFKNQKKIHKKYAFMVK
jgi:serine/threonine-protein phosphatase 5